MPATRRAPPDSAHDSTAMSGDDERLVGELISRRPSAFELIYDRFAATVYPVALMIVGDIESAEQVLEEAFLALWRDPSAVLVERRSLRAHLSASVTARARERIAGRGNAADPGRCSNPTA